MEVTRRDLEVTKQRAGETIHEFVARWRKKVSQVIQWIPEEEQVQMVMKNVLPTLYQYLFAIYLPTFETLIIAYVQVEDALNSGRIQIEEFDKTSFHQDCEEDIALKELSGLHLGDRREI